MISLTTRVTLSALVLLAVFITLTGMTLERAFQESARLAVSERLSAQLYLIMAEAELNEQGRLVMPDNMPTARLDLPGSGLYAWILDAKHNNPLWHSPSVIGLGATPPQVNKLFVERSINDRLYFISALSVKWENYGRSIPLRFVVVEDTQAYQSELQRFRHSLWFWLGIMATLLLLALAILMVWGLRPLRQAASEVSAIEAGRQQRLNRRYPRELQQLTANINTLLAHEQAQRRRYRETLADLAHSLKTPLAILRSQGTPIDGKMLDEQITRMDDIIQYQLQRAANAGRSAMTAPIAVIPILDRLIVGLQKVHHGTGVEVIRHINDEPLFRGDSGDLMELLGNLLDNAFKWCHKQVLVEACNKENQLVLSIADDGPGIDEDLQIQILQRGVRADETTPGNGIGLAIVRDIVDAYGGSLKMDNRRGSGVCVTAMLPGIRRDSPFKTRTQRGFILRAAIKQLDLGSEFYTEEGCHIVELSNTSEDPMVSIAQARVEPGRTTRWHRLREITERYIIIEGQGCVEVGNLPPKEVSAGDVVLIPPMCRQRIGNTGAEDLIFLAICTPRFLSTAYEDIEHDPELRSHFAEHP